MSRQLADLPQTTAWLLFGLFGFVASGQVRVPDRAPKPVSQGEQGKQRSEIHFDPATGTVQIKLLVQDPNGNFIPNIRRENFAVYENGVRVKDVMVDVEHASVSLIFLIEHGGRYQALNKEISEEVSRAGRQLMDVLKRGDKVAIWKYADKPQQLADFSDTPETLAEVFNALPAPEVSEANLYDAVVAVSDRMRSMQGRKAIILASSGVDTFSKATFEDALKAVRASNTPIYVLNLGPALRDIGDLASTPGAARRIDWKRAESELQEIAKTSGGRMYAPRTTLDLAAAYDDIMENLRIRYVITYKTPTDAALNARRTVRVELVDPKTGGPLQITDESGRTIRATVIVQDSYTPSTASGG